VSDAYAALPREAVAPPPRAAARAHRAAARGGARALRGALRGGLEGRGVPPERVLALVKALVAEAATGAEPPLRETGALTHEAVQRSVDAYYAAA
jgi:hypothetical protein